MHLSARLCATVGLQQGRYVQTAASYGESLLEVFSRLSGPARAQVHQGRVDGFHQSQERQAAPPAPPKVVNFHPEPARRQRSGWFQPVGPSPDPPGRASLDPLQQSPDGSPVVARKASDHLLHLYQSGADQPGLSLADADRPERPAWKWRMTLQTRRRTTEGSPSTTAEACMWGSCTWRKTQAQVEPGTWITAESGPPGLHLLVSQEGQNLGDVLQPEDPLRRRPEPVQLKGSRYLRYLFIYLFTCQTHVTVVNW